MWTKWIHKCTLSYKRVIRCKYLYDPVSLLEPPYVCVRMLNAINDCHYVRSVWLHHWLVLSTMTKVR